MAVDGVASVNRRPGRNKQDGRRRPVEKGSGRVIVRLPPLNMLNRQYQIIVNI